MLSSRQGLFPFFSEQNSSSNGSSSSEQNSSSNGGSSSISSSSADGGVSFYLYNGVGLPGKSHWGFSFTSVQEAAV
jgi:hypothetical protein